MTSEEKNRPLAKVGIVAATVLAAVILMGIGFLGGLGTMWVVGPDIRMVMARGDGDAFEGTSRQEKLDLIWEVWAILDREYVLPEEMDDQEMIYGALSGLVSGIGDPYSAFVEPASASILDEDMTGSFEGIGATVDMVDGRFTIVTPLENSPAMEAGLQPGDIVLEADGVSLEGKGLMESITLVRGPKGSVVELLILREGVDEPFVVAVTRDTVDLVTVEYELLTEDQAKIGYVALYDFNAVAGEKVDEAIDDLNDQGAEAYIFDLRGNGGGYLHMAIEVASDFMPKGTLILTEQERGDKITEYRVRSAGDATEPPLVVLVDYGSASASEIVAGALQDNGRAVLVGTETFGKGSVQNTHTLSDGSSLRVTIAKWLLPSGAHLDGDGIDPDIVVELTEENTADDNDPQLDRAIEYLMTGE